MDILLINASVYSLPVSQRADAIVYDGTADLGLWRPPGPDRDLLHAYGETLPDVLAKERAQDENPPPLNHARRLHPGKLRCDYLIWVASRESHGETEPAPAPGLEQLETIAESALALAARHGAVRVAFGTAGAGPGAPPAAERLTALVRGAHAYRRGCLAQGRATPIEEVYVCSPSAADIAKAKRATARLAKEQAPKPEPRLAAESDRTRAPRRGGSQPRASRARRSPKLAVDAIASARSSAEAYDRSRVYNEGDWFIHPRFGVGQVRTVLGPQRMVTVLFEDGEERRLIHGR